LLEGRLRSHGWRLYCERDRAKTLAVQRIEEIEGLFLSHSKYKFSDYVNWDDRFIW
jgi:hypothetical protein